MSPGNEHLEYRFGDYCLPSWEQVYYKNGERRPISTKLYYLLLLLVKSAGQVVSKDDMIDTLWPRQVVSDTTLAKQILRLRKLLKDHQREQPFIETHRGIGYRFTPTVTVSEAQTEQSDQASMAGKTASHKARIWKLAAGAFGVVLLSGFLWYNTTLSDPPAPAPPTANAAADAPIKVAILPLGSDQDWLNKGGRDYLAEKLSQDPKISSVSPPSRWLPDASGESLAIDLTAHGNLNYSCLVAISESDGEYRADVKLRTDSEVVSSTEIHATSLPELFDKTNNWIRNNLAVHANLDDLSPDAAARVDDYALQSYLHGQFELTANENRKKAGEYFQAAVARDPDFLEAWAQLARNHMALGEFKQAISIAQTVLARPDIQFSAELLLDLNYIIGISYGRLHHVDETLHYLNRAKELITSSNDPYAKLSALEALSALAMYERRFEEAEALALQSLQIAESDYHLPNYLANLHLTIARAIEMGGNSERTLPHINQALELWSQTDNANGMMKGYHMLTNFYYQMGFIDDGIQVLVKGDPYLKRASVVYEKAFYMQNGGLLLNLRGQFNHANRYAEQLKQFAVETNNPIYLVLSELIAVHQLYIQNRFSDATDHALAILNKFETEGSVQSAFPDIMALAILTSARGNPPAQTRALIEKFDALFKSHRERLRNDMTRAEGHLAIREGRVDEGLNLLQESEDNNREKGFRHIGDYIATEQLEVLLNHPDRDYKQLLARTEDSAGYGYLLWKLKARFLAREGNYFEATRLMNENKLKANQLWTSQDQLMLEDFQARTKPLTSD